MKLIQDVRYRYLIHEAPLEGNRVSGFHEWLGLDGAKFVRHSSVQCILTETTPANHFQKREPVVDEGFGEKNRPGTSVATHAAD